MALTICQHCSHHIWIGSGPSVENHDRLVHEEQGPPEYGRVTGIVCPKCERVHSAPDKGKEDWFE